MFDQIVSIRNLCGVPAIQKSILLNLATRMGKNQTAWPSVQRLSLDVGCSRRTLQQNLRLLAERGLLQIFERRDGKSCNHYRLTLQKPELAEVDELMSAFEQTGGRSLSEAEIELLEANGVTVDPGPAANQMSFSWPDEPAAETSAVPASDGRSRCAPPAQQLRPKEQSKKKNTNTTHVVYKDSVRKPVHRSPSLLRRDHSGKPLSGQKLLWKALTDELLERIVGTNNLEEFRRYDAEGCQAFGWKAGFGDRRERWASWKSTVAWARTKRAAGTSVSSAAVLKAALKRLSTGDRETLLYVSDEHLSKARVELSGDVLQPSSGASQEFLRMKSVTALVADPEADGMESWMKQ